MNEWGVVTVVIALVGLIVTVAKPVITLTKSITTLTVVVKALESDVEEQRKQAIDSHSKLWAHNTEQDNTLTDHERRIGILESHKEGNRHDEL